MTSPSGASASAAAVGQRSSQRTYRGITRSTCVCCSITSETRMEYGSRVLRHGRSRPECSSQPSRSASKLAIEARLLEVEVTDDAAHDHVVDPPLPPQVEDRASLGDEDLANEALVIERAALELSVALWVETAAKALPPEVEHRSDPFERVVPHPVLVGELAKRSGTPLRRVDPPLVLLLLGARLVLDPEQLNERGEREALDDERHEDDGEGQEDDELSARERFAGVRRERKRQRRGERDRASHP